MRYSISLLSYKTSISQSMKLALSKMITSCMAVSALQAVKDHQMEPLGKPQLITMETLSGLKHNVQLNVILCFSQENPFVPFNLSILEDK